MEEIVDELKQIRITLLIHAVTAIAIGWISNFLNSWVSFPIGIGALVAAGYLSEMITKKRGMKFWFANGIFIYIMLWLISWTIFMNL